MRKRRAGLRVLRRSYANGGGDFPEEVNLVDLKNN